MTAAVPTALPAIVLFAHGSRDAEWAQPFETIRRSIQRKRPGSAVELAFLEFMTPQLAAAVAGLAAAGHRRIVIAPLFMARGGHLRRDLPQIVAALRTAHPHVVIELLPAIGDVEPLLETISDWVVSAAGAPSVDPEKEKP